MAEPAAADGRVATVPGEFAWDDIGDFRSLSDVLGEAAGDVRVLGDADLVRSDSASGLVVPGSGRIVALLGVDDVVVVDTPTPFWSPPALARRRSRRSSTASGRPDART